MPFPANVYKVMIASPGDVSTERQIVRDVIHEWNTINSEDKALVLSPIGWETHSTPELGDRAQSIINKQVLHGCDLLVAAFWTRLGTPTGESISGTVEEIEEHVKAGKPAMIYFSNAPVVMGSVDTEQYDKLQEFKKVCYEWGLVETYDSIGEFRDKLARQLAQTVINNSYFATASAGIEIPASVEESKPSLSAEAAELLSAASSDTNGTLAMLGTLQGLIIQANNKQFGTPGDPRSEAKYKGAAEELRSLGLIEDRGHKGEIFRVTNEGYRVADLLG